MTEFQATETLFELIVAQRDVLSQLRQYAATQYKIVEGNELGKLVSLLAQKQAAINRLTEIDESLAQFRDQDPDARVWHSTDRRDECRRIAKECPKLLSDVMQLEKAAESRLQSRRTEVAERVEVRNKKSESIQTYVENSTAGAAPSQFNVQE